MKMEEKALLNFKLGIKDEFTTGCTDIKQVLERVRAKKTEPVSSLSAVEIKELTKRGDEFAELPEKKVCKVEGIGFESKNLVSTKKSVQQQGKVGSDLALLKGTVDSSAAKYLGNTEAH